MAKFWNGRESEMMDISGATVIEQGKGALIVQKDDKKYRVTIEMFDGFDEICHECTFGKLVVS